MSNTTIILCDYCQQPALLVGGEAIYPHRRDLYTREFWHCAPCSAWVGCHPGTARPLGRLADADLRAAKQQAHAAFDPFWRKANMKRNHAYGWLAKRLGIERERCHIGMFDVETCRRVVAICNLKIHPIPCGNESTSCRTSSFRSK